LVQIGGMWGVGAVYVFASLLFAKLPSCLQKDALTSLAHFLVFVPGFLAKARFALIGATCRLLPGGWWISLASQSAPTQPSIPTSGFECPPPVQKTLGDRSKVGLPWVLRSLGLGANFAG
jgi:hypothetical protein